MLLLLLPHTIQIPKQQAKADNKPNIKKYMYITGKGIAVCQFKIDAGSNINKHPHQPRKK